MSINIENTVNCALCNKPINSTDKSLSFPNLTSNIIDPLYLISDNLVHEKCFDTFKFKIIVEELLDELEKKRPSLESICIIDNKIINNPKDIIFFGLLTSDKSEKLYSFNFTVISKLNLLEWENKNYFIFLMKKFIEENKWKSLTDFNYLNYLLNIIEGK
jgi:hypothetical protein